MGDILWLFSFPLAGLAVQSLFKGRLRSGSPVQKKKTKRSIIIFCKIFRATSMYAAGFFLTALFRCTKAGTRRTWIDP